MPNTLQIASVTLTQAQLEGTAPITIVAAPGATHYIVPVSVEYRANFKTAPYASSNGPGALYLGTNPPVNVDNGDASIMEQSASCVLFQGAICTGNVGGFAALAATLAPNQGPILDQPLVYCGPGYTGGDGTLTITVVYYINGPIS